MKKLYLLGINVQTNKEPGGKKVYFIQSSECKQYCKKKIKPIETHKNKQKKLKKI